MPRPRKVRRAEELPKCCLFKPAGVPRVQMETIELSHDEVEALRLIDRLGWYQERAAEEMGVSRQTIGRILLAARHKVAEALLEGKALAFIDGPVEIQPCRGERRLRRQRRAGSK